MGHDYLSILWPFLAILVGFALVYFPCRFLKNWVRHLLSGSFIGVDFILALTGTIITSLGGHFRIGDADGGDVSLYLWLAFAGMALTYLVFWLVWGIRKDKDSKEKAKASEEAKVDIKNL
jgi:hypothetical protein